LINVLKVAACVVTFSDISATAPASARAIATSNSTFTPATTDLVIDSRRRVVEAVIDLIVTSAIGTPSDSATPLRMASCMLGSLVSPATLIPAIGIAVVTAAFGTSTMATMSGTPHCLLEHEPSAKHLFLTTVASVALHVRKDGQMLSE
jgi:hypothetical protein